MFLDALAAEALDDQVIGVHVHDAHFHWDPNDKILTEVLAACKGGVLDAARRHQPGAAADDEMAEDDIKDVLPEQ